MIDRIINWLIEDGTTNTENGSWIVYFDVVTNIFGVSIEWLRNNLNDILEKLDSREEILSETWIDDDAFDMNFCLSACKYWDGTDEWGCC